MASLTVAKNVSIEKGSLLKSTADSEDSRRFSALAVLDVPDGHFFEIAISVVGSVVGPERAGICCGFGILHGQPLPSEGPCTGDFNTWCRQWQAFFVAHVGKRSARWFAYPSKSGDEFLPQHVPQMVGPLEEYCSLSMRYSSGILQFKLNEDWHAVNDLFDIPPDRTKQYRPFILLDRENSAVEIKMSRKRSCPSNSAKLWQQRHFTDAVVLCNGEKFEVHRAIVCAASPIFERAFMGGMREALEARYEIKDSQPAAVEALLKYMYTSELEARPEILPAVLELAVQYEVGELCDEVSVALLEGVTEKNARSRAQVLRRLSAHSQIAPSWDRFLELLMRNKALLACAVI